jgi:hypothetical protein
MEGPSDVIVHEWGTFLAMSGSDGTTLDGMYHEEHALPAFVHARSRDQLRIPSICIKGETPVIYFYTQTRQRVRVGVGFPHGFWTQWYPQAAALIPPLEQNDDRPGRPRHGRICWYAELIPSVGVKLETGKAKDPKARPEVELPEPSSDALWNYAREVDAAFVKTSDGTKDPARPEFEKFLFYRGLGEAPLPLRLDAQRGGTLTLLPQANLGDGVRHVFVLRVENGRGAFRQIPSLRPGQQLSDVIPSIDRGQPLDRFTQDVSDALASGLTESGLYAKEARAMVNTWRNSYFRTDGVRVLFVMPQSWTDTFIPITVVPTPKQVVRVMVGRLELLTPERERLAENALRCLPEKDAGKRRQAYQFLNEQGRYVEPIVRRVLRTTKDEGVRTLCRRLLLTELVTELRAAVNNAADGKRLETNPFLLRARLARLLRDVGLLAEARDEGKALLASLKQYPLPAGQTPNSSPEVLELRAAAFDAMGDDRNAGVTFARRIELHAQSMGQTIDPSVIPDLRDWWVGRAYAHCVVRSGRAQTIVGALEETLAPPPQGANARRDDDRSSRILLGFLLDEQGESAAADSHWNRLTQAPKLDAAAALENPADKGVKQSGL